MEAGHSRQHRPVQATNYCLRDSFTGTTHGGKDKFSFQLSLVKFQIASANTFFAQKCSLAI